MILPIERSEIERFHSIVTARTGLTFSGNRIDDLVRVLRSRVERAASGRVAAYVDRVATDAGWQAELSSLVGPLTVPETYFFRYADHFRALVEEVLPRFRRDRHPNRPIRVLSAGCATGEEPYTIAILAREHAAEIGAAPAEIVGVDINPASIDTAARGRYTEWSFRETPPALRERHFRGDGRDLVLGDEIRRAVSFEKRNLVDEDPLFWRPGAFDVIFCRNVLMYFSSEATRKVVARLSRALEPSGFLFLGHAETLRGISSDFHLCHTHGTFYYQRRFAGRHSSPLRGDAPAAPAAAPSITLGPGWTEPIERFVASIQNASDRIQNLTRESPPAGETSPAAPAPPLPLARTPSTWERDVAVDLLRRERFGDAIEFLRTLEPSAAADPDALLVQALALVNTGEISRAEDTCRRLLEIDELNAGAHYVFALCREHAGDRSGVVDHDVTAIYLDPSFAMPHLHLGLASKRRGDRATAKRELGQALALLPAEDAARILFFGGGFTREALIRACRTEIDAMGGVE